MIIISKEKIKYKYYELLNINAPVAQLDRVPDYGSGG